MATKTPKFARFCVNKLLSFATVEVEGGITRLEAKARAAFGELARRVETGSFTVPPKAQWRYFVRGMKDVYEIRLEIHYSDNAVESALHDMFLDRPAPSSTK